MNYMSELACDIILHRMTSMSELALMHLASQISRLIEMQTPLYLERVQHIHSSVLHQQQQCTPDLATDRSISQSAPL
jgi:hypothetical protein